MKIPFIWFMFIRKSLTESVIFKTDEKITPYIYDGQNMNAFTISIDKNQQKNFMISAEVVKNQVCSFVLKHLTRENSVFLSRIVPYILRYLHLSYIKQREKDARK